jgi:threonine/homoserine/homoserine lactone efflux protein
MVVYLLPPILGLVLSFIGSLPLGMINMTVAETAIQKGNRQALTVALGAAIIEFIQAWVAITCTHLILGNTSMELLFNGIAVVVFFLLAAYYFWQSGIQNSHLPEKKRTQLPDFWKGVAVSSLNVMVFPYWIFYATYLNVNEWMQLDQLSILLFSGGVMLGAFLLFALYARLGLWIVQRAAIVTRYADLIIAIILLLFGLFQLYRFLAIYLA